tara:strand:- start:459 stop:665 length:207 start_codon:yes stop_codon:yes gene_type:complete
MSYLLHLKRIEMNKDTRWIVKLCANGKIKEVKLIFNPKEYIKSNKARKLLTQKEIINILEIEKKHINI